MEQQTCRRYPGRAALVTGAGSGIGAATALRLASEGAHVMVTDVDADAADCTVASIREIDSVRDSGGTAEACALDATEPDDWRTVRSRVDGLDLVVLNVGRNEVGRITELTEPSWHDQLRLSLDTVFHGAHTMLPVLRRPGGSLVITSSIHALQGFPGFPAYAAAKGAIMSLVRQLAVDYAPELRVNAVVPGAIATPLWQRRDDAFRAKVTRLAPLGRLGHPDDVAAAVAFLGSHDADFVTGHHLVVDGGRTATAQEWLTGPDA